MIRKGEDSSRGRSGEATSKLYDTKENPALSFFSIDCF